MEIKQLRAFLAVADHLHFGHAADSLYMAQAPLSRIIKSLEAELGAALFERSTRSVELTSAGRALREPAAEVVEAVDRASATVRGVIDGSLGTVAVEFSGVATHTLIARLARTMRRSRPGITLDLSSQIVSRPSMQALVERRVDIALGRWDYFPPGVTSRVLRRDALAIALPASHRLASMAAISFDHIRSESFVALPASGGSVTTDRLYRLFHTAGIPIDRIQFAPDTPSCIALVSAGVGVHLALASVGQRQTNPDVVFVPLAESDVARMPDVHLRAIWRVTEESLAVIGVRDTLLTFAERIDES